MDIDENKIIGDPNAPNKDTNTIVKIVKTSPSEELKGVTEEIVEVDVDEGGTVPTCKTHNIGTELSYTTLCTTIKLNSIKLDLIKFTQIR